MGTQTQTVRLSQTILDKLDAIGAGMGALGGSRSAVVRVLADGCPTGNEALIRLVNAQADADAKEGAA